MKTCIRTRHREKGMKLPCPPQACYSPSSFKYSIWTLSEPHTLGIFMEASSHRHDRSLTPFSALLPSQENGGRGRKFQASNHGLVFLVADQHSSSRHPGAHPESPHRNKDTPITQKTTRVSGALHQEPGSKTNY